MYAEFKDIFYDVKYEYPLAKSEKGYLVNKLFLVLWKNIYIYIWIYFDDIVSSGMKTFDVIAEDIIYI